MSLPSTNANGQPSIRNFFKPKPPSYAPPPSAASRTAAAPPPPPASATPPTAQIGLKSPPPSSTSIPAPAPAPASSWPTSLHPQATISPILPEYIPALRRITSLLLPVNYPDTFYQRLSDPLSSGAFSRVLLWTDDPSSDAPPKVIGGLVCRPEPSPFAPSSQKTPDKPNAVYIQSLVLLAPYRQNGLAAALLDEVVKLAAESPFACEEVYAHVWTDNEDGLRWYLARGFAKHGQVNGYYFKLRPDSAWIVRRPVDASGTVSGQNGRGVPNGAATGVISPSATAAAANLISQQRTSVPTPPVLATTSGTPGPLSPPLGPPRSGGPSPNRSPGRGLSFQNARPDMEWNDLPADMHSAANSNASSRSSSAAPRKKRDRAYPAAAFGK
ncbi:acyl-CoA N-acyltransferase [Hypoxylon sp. FL1150]|nr:acyl-CoA N-acyltransferase [Hypoxylon sp. FL1150]